MKVEKVFLSLLPESDKNNFYKLVFENLKDLSNEYPHFNQWYWFKVIPEIMTGSREMITLINNNDFVGVSILKKSENKICTMRVNEKYQGNGFGKELFIASFESLNNEKPIITVSELRMFEFRRIFSYLGFKLEDVGYDYYSKNKKELSYNGLLDNKVEKDKIEAI